MSDLPAIPLTSGLAKAIRSVNQAVPLISSRLPSSLTRYHGVSAQFTQTLPVFYADNSIQKETLLRSKAKTRKFSLEKRQCIAHFRVQKVEMKRNLVNLQKEARIHEKAVKRHISAIIKQTETAAITIQRHVRGWICRLALEKELITKGKEDVKGKVKSMVGFATRFYMTTGNGPGEAAVRLQRAFRRFHRVKMIRVMAKAYEIYRTRLELSLTPIITSFLRQRLAYAHLQALKFEHFKTFRLIEIHHNLIRLRLNRWWKRLNFSFKAIQDRIKRFRRRKNAHKLKQVKQQHLSPGGCMRTSVDGESPESQNQLDLVGEGVPVSQLTQESGMDNSESLRRRRTSFSSEELSTGGESQALEEERIRKHKEDLKQKMTACGIYPTKEIPLFPLLSEKNVSDFSTKTKANVFARVLMPTDAFSHRSTTACFSPNVQKPGHRRTVTSTPQSVPSKRSAFGSPASPPMSVTIPNDEYRSLDTDDQYPPFRLKKPPEPRYLQPTESFNSALEAKAGSSFSKTLVLPKKPWNPKSSILNKTVAFAVKERGKRWVEDDPRDPWLPLTSVYEPHYVPALDNRGYHPKRFKARPLDRKILDSPKWISTPGDSNRRGSPLSPLPFIDIPSLNPYLISFPQADSSPRYEFHPRPRGTQLNTSI